MRPASPRYRTIDCAHHRGVKCASRPDATRLASRCRYNAFTAQCYQNSALNCDSDACQNATASLLRAKTVCAASGVKLSTHKDFAAYATALQGIVGWAAKCDACGSTWAGSSARQAVLCKAGCTNSSAYNYDPKAKKDDGSCNHDSCSSTINNNCHANATCYTTHGTSSKLYNCTCKRGFTGSGTVGSGSGSGCSPVACSLSTLKAPT